MNAYTSPESLLERDLSAERFEPETPFLETDFAAESWAATETSAVALEQQWAPQLETPFITAYHGETPVNPETQALEQTLMELFDRDFNEAVANFALEAAAQAEHFAASTGAAAVPQLLSEWMEPLRRAAEQTLEQAAEAASQSQFDSLSESEVNTLFENLAPPPGAVPPEFEDFLKKVFNKVKNVAKTVAKAAKAGISAIGKVLPIGAILKKIIPLVRPLLNRVIRFAIGKLPAALRPAATLLGRRLGVLRETGEVDREEETDREAPTTAAAETIGQQFDVEVATLLFARDEGEGELLLSEASQETMESGETSPVAEADAARERFVSQFAQLQSGENAGPVVQQFIPAILPALRIGINVIGRQRVVNFLAGHLAKLIQPHVGPAAATALSRALVNVGLRMVTLEAAENEAPPQMAARAVAATLEDTMRRIAGFGFENFDNLEASPEQRQLLESVANESFFEAAMAHFPAQLLDVRRLEEREMYLEAPSQQAVWVYRPHPRYKKYTHVFEVTVTPQVAAQIPSFGGERLDAFLRARGVRLPAKVKIHLYEAIPGTTLSHISLLEKVPGLGSGAEAAWSKIHPLTTQAAGLLLREPALGRNMEARWLESRHRIGVGQRFYYIEVPNASSGGGTGTACSKASQINITVDLRSSQVRVFAYFSEADAQKIAAAGPSVGPMTAWRIAEGLAGGAITSIRTGGPSQHVTFIKEAGELEGEEFLQAIAGQAAKKIVQWLLVELAKALLVALKNALIRYFNARLAEFTTATRNKACGVTVVFTFNHPGLRVIHVALAGRVPNMSDVRAAAKALQLPSAAIVPGFKR